MTRKLKAAGSIIITASHNPREWNGLKFVRCDGTFLNASEAKKFYDIYYKTKPIPKKPTPKRKINFQKNAIDLHIKEVLKHLDVKSIRTRKFKVAIDYCNGTGAVSTPKFLKKLGCKVFPINTNPDGKFAHNPEPTPKNLAQLSKLVKRTKADVGFAQDPDADRLAVVSEAAKPIGEENTLTLAVKYVLSGSKKQRVVVNLSTSRMIDDIAKEFSAKVYRTAVGETNVVNKMRKINAIIGGEGNGGVIYPAVNFGRDSFVAMGLILQYMAASKEKISKLVSLIPQYKMVKVKFECSAGKTPAIISRVKKKFGHQKINYLDGVRIDWPDSWVHIRPSNTEPIIRIIAEAKSINKARQLAKEVF